MVRSDVLYRFVYFGAMPRLFEDLGPNIGERVERSIRRTPSCFSRSATRRLTVEVGIFKSRAASEKLLASTTFAKIINEFRSVIAPTYLVP